MHEGVRRVFTFMNLSISDLNLPKDPAFLIFLSNLFHSSIQYGKNEFLKLSVLEFLNI